MSKQAFIIMGVAGSGKTTIGRAAAEELGLPFLEGDDFHPVANVNKMSAGIPLTNEDRKPWIMMLCNAAMELPDRACIISCSALNPTVRDYIARGFDGEIIYIHLAVSREKLEERLSNRPDHFMKPEMLDSQFEALSPPPEAQTINANRPMPSVLDKVTTHIRSTLTPT